MKRLSLSEPNVVLSVPRFVQAAFAASSVAFLVWLSVAILRIREAGESFEPAHYLGLVLAGVLLFTLARPGFWKAWISAAADRYGVYLRDRRGSWHCVSWKQVREVAVERDANSHHAPRLVIYAHLSEEERKALAPGSWIFQGLGNERKPLGLIVPNRFGDVDEQQEAIEGLRHAA